MEFHFDSFPDYFLGNITRTFFISNCHFPAPATLIPCRHRVSHYFSELPPYFVAYTITAVIKWNSVIAYFSVTVSARAVILCSSLHPVAGTKEVLKKWCCTENHYILLRESVQNKEIRKCLYARRQRIHQTEYTVLQGNKRTCKCKNQEKKTTQGEIMSTVGGWRLGKWY